MWVSLFTGNVAAISALAVRVVWTPDRWRIAPLLVALVLAVVALDDVLQHAFGWGTPLDWAWKNHLRPLLPSH